MVLFRFHAIFFVSYFSDLTTCCFFIAVILQKDKIWDVISLFWCTKNKNRKKYVKKDFATVRSFEIKYNRVFLVSREATLYSLCLSVSQFVFIFSAPIEDRQLKFSVKIPMTYAHRVYTLFCPTVSRSCFKIHKPFF